eukprot:scaffold4160_cov258-Chaetoceros_neogracile.AAC.7
MTFAALFFTHIISERVLSVPPRPRRSQGRGSDSSNTKSRQSPHYHQQCKNESRQRIMNRRQINGSLID